MSTLDGLLELESSLPSSVLDVVVEAPEQIHHFKLSKNKLKNLNKFPFKLKNFYHQKGQKFVPRSQRQQKELDEVYDMLLEQEKSRRSGKTSEIDPENLRLLKKIVKPKPRPATPTRVLDESIDKVEQAALTLQRLIRGKAIQKQWIEGVERRKDLLAELRSTKSLEKEEQAAQNERQRAVKTQQKILAGDREKKDIVENIMKDLIGETVMDRLDFVSKELVRLQEERRLHALSLLAERRRRIDEM